MVEVGQLLWMIVHLGWGLLMWVIIGLLVGGGIAWGVGSESNVLAWAIGAIVSATGIGFAIRGGIIEQREEDAQRHERIASSARQPVKSALRRLTANS